MSGDFQVFLKPVGSLCNLHCSYCYYLGKGSSGIPASGRKMTREFLERYIPMQISAASPAKEIFFSWHGGEPLLAGIDFYRTVLEIQTLHKPGDTVIINGIQTNATLIDDAWADFLAENRFYTGISIDGTHFLHDRNRVTPEGSPSFMRTFEGYLKLIERGVAPEILCVVSSHNASQPERVYSFLKSLGAKYITFIPLVEQDRTNKNEVLPASVGAEAFGNFLCSIFDTWLAEDIGRVKIQVIEEALRCAFGQGHTLCIFKESCGAVPVIDFNGDFYTCDHYVDEMNLVGNINDSSLTELLLSQKQRAFGDAKLNTLPGYCLDCEVRQMCNGECPKNRFISSPLGEANLNYLCKGYKTFFNHVRPFVETVRQEWLKNQ